MIVRWLLACVLLFIASSVSAQQVVPSSPSDEGERVSYKLGAGDVITIEVFGEDDLSRENVRISDTGTVRYPVIGEIQVLGSTLGQLEKRITDGLRGRYLVNPRVAVRVVEYRQFYVNGQVEKPGGYPFQPGLNVAKAISLASGLKDRASVNKMYLVKEGDSSHTKIKVQMNDSIGPGDILTIEESFF